MKGLVFALVATISIQLLTMAQGVLSARLLLPEGKGALTAAMLWPALLASLGALGIADAVAFAVSKSDDTETKRIAASALWVMALVSGVLVGVGYLGLPAVLSNYGPELVITSQLYLWHIPPTLLTACLLGILLGKLRLTHVNVLRVSVYVIILMLMILFYFLNKVSVYNFALAFLTTSWGVFFLAVIFVLKDGWVGWLPSLDTMKKLLGYGVKVHIGSLAGMFNLQLDQLLLSIFLAHSVLGLYVIAVTVGAGANLAASTIAYWVAFPQLSNLPTGLLKSKRLGRYMRLALLLSLFSVMILFVAAPWLITFFFGSAYVGSIGMARILIIAAIPLGCNAVFTAGFKSYNLPAISSYAEIIGLVVTGLALLMLLPTYQALGAAWASLLAYSATFVYLLAQSRQSLDIQLSELFLPCWDDWYYLRNLARIR